MFQPFERFTEQYMNGLIKLKKIYLVTQTYDRGFDHFENNDKVDILISDYDDSVEAQKHYHAVKTDKYASIINLENPKHKDKLVEMMDVNSKYRLFWAVVKDAKQTMKQMDAKYKDNVRRYISQKTNLNPKASETVSTSLVVIFGKLHLIIKAGNKPITVNFEEIEKI